MESSGYGYGDGMDMLLSTMEMLEKNQPVHD